MKNPILSRTLAGAIVERLRQEILLGTHPPGTQLRQDALAVSYAVSRIPVREALLQLEAEGLVAIEPHRGAVVTPLSPEEIQDVFELRLMLEPRLMRSSIPELSTEDLDRLDALQGEFAKAIVAGDAGRWGKLNAELHLAMYARASQPRTLAIVASLLQTSERYTRLQLATREALERAEHEHGELIRLCRHRDAEGAARAIAAHIAAVQVDLAGIVGKPGHTVAPQPDRRRA